MTTFKGASGSAARFLCRALAVGADVSMLKSVVLAFAVSALTLILLVPKWALGRYAEKVLSIPLDAERWAWLLVQDAALSVAMAALMLSAIRRGRHFALWVGCAHIALFAMLFIDARARQLWLQPIEPDLIVYFLQDFGGLIDGAPVFLNGLTVWNMTFRRAAFFIVIMAALLVMLIAALSSTRPVPSDPLLLRPRWLLVLSLGLMALAMLSPRLPYQLERLGYLGQFFEPIRLHHPEVGSADTIRMAALFEQPVVPLAEQWKEPRQFLSDVRPFDHGGSVPGVA